MHATCFFSGIVERRTLCAQGLPPSAALDQQNSSWISKGDAENERDSIVICGCCFDDLDVDGRAVVDELFEPRPMTRDELWPSASGRASSSTFETSAVAAQCCCCLITATEQKVALSVFNACTLKSLSQNECGTWCSMRLKWHSWTDSR